MNGGELHETNKNDDDCKGNPAKIGRVESNPSNSEELAFALHKAVRMSGLSLTEIANRLKLEYGVELSVSGLSHVINRGTIKFQRALQILAICGVSKYQIKEVISGSVTND